MWRRVLGSSSIILLLLVCLVSGSQWLLPETNLTPVSELISLCIGSGTVFLLIRFLPKPRRRLMASLNSHDLRLGLYGIGVFAAPALLLVLGRQRLSGVMATATQAGVPVVVAVSIGVIDSGSDLQKRLLPGLLALTGVLLVLPVALPSTPAGWFGFILYLLAAVVGGVSTVFCHREMASFEGREAITIVAGANAAFLWVLTGFWLTVSRNGHLFGTLTVPEVLLPSLWELVSSFGVVILLGILPPLPVGVRFVLTPLIAAMEAYLLLRPTLTFRAACGILLMVTGGVACLRAGGTESSSPKVSLSRYLFGPAANQ